MDSGRHTASQSAVTIYQLFREAIRRGLTEDELFRCTGLRLHEVADFRRRVEAATLFDVWETLMRRLRDPGLPVRAARGAQGDPRSALSLIVEASGTVGEALEHVTRYGSAWSTVYALRIQPRPDGAVVATIDGLGVDRLGERCEAEYTMTEVVLMLRSYAGARTPLPVRFAHPAPVRAGAHRRHFGPTLRFDAPRTEIVIPASIVEHPLRTARPGLVAVLAPQLDELTVRIHQPQAYTAAVRQAVLDRLGREPITATTTARLLVVSERTLHRRLAAEGTSLRRLLDETRRALAIELLDERQHPVKEVASALGFASARSLHRAYRRWTGTTPRGRSSSVAG